MKKKVDEESSMGPRELARHVVVNMYQYFESTGSTYDNQEKLHNQHLEFNHFLSALHEDHLKKMDTNQYVVYLEQLLTELGIFEYKELLDKTISLHKNKVSSAEREDMIAKRVILSNHRIESENKLREAQQKNTAVYDMLINSKYTEWVCLHSRFTKNYWENVIIKE